MKVPFIAVVGEQEAANRMVNVNDRDDKRSGNMGIDAFVEMMVQENRPGGKSSGQ